MMKLEGFAKLLDMGRVPLPYGRLLGIITGVVAAGGIGVEEEGVGEEAGNEDEEFS